MIILNQDKGIQLTFTNCLIHQRTMNNIGIGRWRINIKLIYPMFHSIWVGEKSKHPHAQSCMQEKKRASERERKRENSSESLGTKTQHIND